MFTDNVNVTKVVADNVPGIYAYSWGTTIITYTAYDAANNTATCVITIDIIDQSNYSLLKKQNKTKEKGKKKKKKGKKRF